MPDPLIDPPIFTTPQLAHHLQLPESTVRKLAKRGKIPAFKPSNKAWRYSRTAIDAWIESRENQQMGRRG